MVKPVSSSQILSGEGNEKYEPTLKRGPGEFDKTLERIKAENSRAEISKMAEETRAKAEAERPRTYTERLQDMGRLPKSGGGGTGGGGAADIPPGFMPGKQAGKGPINYQKGGSVRGHGIESKGRTKGRFV